MRRRVCSTTLPGALQCRQGFGHVVAILGRVTDILQATGRDTTLDMAALLKREALDAIGGPLPLHHLGIMIVGNYGLVMLLIRNLGADWGRLRCSRRPGGLWV